MSVRSAFGIPSARSSADPHGSRGGRGADDDQRGRGDLVEASRGGGLGPAHRARRGRPLVGGDNGLERLTLHRADTLPLLRGDRRPIPSVPVQPGPEVEGDRLVDLPGVEQRVLLLVESVELGRAFIAGQGRGDEDERLRPPGIGQGEVERDAAAEGVADERHSLEGEVVEERPDVLDVGERPARERRLAEAPQIRSNDVVPPTKGLDLAVPEPAVAHAGMEEDDRGPVAEGVVGDLGAVDAGGAQLPGACCPSR